MWDRVILKSNAKMALSGGRYWTAYAVCVISSLITSLFFIVERFTETRPLSATLQMDPTDYSLYLQNETNKMTHAGFPSFLLWIFIGLPLVVGVARFFVRNRFGETKLETMFSCFRSSYASTVGGMFTTALFNFLWYFAFHHSRHRQADGIFHGAVYSFG